MPLFGNPVNVDIVLDDEDTRTKVVVQRSDGAGEEELYRFLGRESVSGAVIVRLKEPSRSFEHLGIKIEFIGTIDLFFDRGNHFDFTAQELDLAPEGFIDQGELAFRFAFDQPEMPYESYNGANCRLRYYLKVTVLRSFFANITHEMDLWVVNYHKPPETNHPIKYHVGVEEYMHIEFEIDKTKYHVKDVVVGRVIFPLVRIRIKYMELCLVRRETTGHQPNIYTDDENITRFEIMDGASVAGETIPVRLFLGNFDLTPTYRNVHSKFSVKYFLNLVLVDDEDRRYFKQQEIILWRCSPAHLMPKHHVDKPLENPKPKRRTPIGTE